MPQRLYINFTIYFLLYWVINLGAFHFSIGETEFDLLPNKNLSSELL